MTEEDYLLKPDNSRSSRARSRRTFLQASVSGAIGASVFPALAGARQMESQVREAGCG